MWSQTPRFSLVLDPKDDIGLHMEVHHGLIKSLDFENSNLPDSALAALRTTLVGMKLQDLWSSETFLQSNDPSENDHFVTVVRRLHELLPVPALFKR